MFFLSSFLSFLYSIALLCSIKKSLNRTKIAIFRFNQKSQDKFNKKTVYFLKLQDIQPNFVSLEQKMKRNCLECGEKLSEREDKKFCNDACRNNRKMRILFNNFPDNS